MDSILSETISFNLSPPTLMHIDLNSCFASVEQQANPRLRGKPVAVAAYVSDGGCILAASYEAKKSGVTTGVRVRDGLKLCPDLIVLPPDPNKYRFVNRKLLCLLQEYSADVEVKSIDEMVLNLDRSPILETKIKQISDVNFINKENGYMVTWLHGYKTKMSYSDGEINNVTMKQCSNVNHSQIILAMLEIGADIKNRIKSQIGDYLTVSIGISTNRFLAKTASGLHKPDGLDVITKDNIEPVLKSLKLEDLCGIKEGYGGRLRLWGIDTAWKFYGASIRDLRSAFSSIVGYYWWLRLHGFEADDRQFGRKSFGHSHALYEPYARSDKRLHQVLCQLTEKMGRRLRRNGYCTRGIHLSCLFDTGNRPAKPQSGWSRIGNSKYSYWHKGRKLAVPLYAGDDLYREAMRVLSKSPDLPVRILSVACYYLTDNLSQQLDLYTDDRRKKQLVKASDTINDRWGELTVFPARLLAGKRQVLDRIAFGGVKELEEFTFREQVDYV